MSVSNSRLGTVAKWSAIPVGLILSAALVWQASYSAFSATTSNPTNNWATGTVALSDDDSNTAMFNATTLKPGSTGTKCIAVTSTGTLAAAVKLYGTGVATTNALSSYVNLTVQQGTGGSFASCVGFVQDAGAPNLFTGTLAAFATAYTNFGNGFGTWTPAGGTVSKTYQIVYTIDAATPNSAQGSTASIGLTWESQNS
ncbi:MAG: hypothetical protein DLM59_05305 [Pseudonocardiales bacterium]|nr:MAG: hypothetical protein DLM59_05305 [Pseudonocardiales bacterium]